MTAGTVNSRYLHKTSPQKIFLRASLDRLFKSPRSFNYRLDRVRDILFHNVIDRSYKFLRKTWLPVHLVKLKPIFTC